MAGVAGRTAVPTPARLRSPSLGQPRHRCRMQPTHPRCEREAESIPARQGAEPMQPPKYTGLASGCGAGKSEKGFSNSGFFQLRRGKSSVTSVFWQTAACLQTCKYNFTIAINPIVQYSLEPIRF